MDRPLTKSISDMAAGYGREASKTLRSEMRHRLK